MTEKQMDFALTRCCKSSPISCKYCLLFEYKFNSDGTCNFGCASDDRLKQKELQVALEKVIRKNPVMFPSELVAQVCKARVV